MANVFKAKNVVVHAYQVTAGLVEGREEVCNKSREATIDEVVYKASETGLHILTTAKKGTKQRRERRRQPLVPEVCTAHRGLARKYDLAFRDTPPTLVVVDARIISKQAYAGVYLVHRNETPFGAVLEGPK